jgi:hypothetical protein
MARLYLKDTPATGSIALWNLKEHLKAAGWEHQASGQGTSGTFSVTPGNVNDVLTSGEKFTRTYGWIVLRDPGGSREIVLQKGSTSQNLHAAYSFSAHYTGTGNGAISAIVAPTATDSKTLEGTTEIPVNYSTFWPTDGTYRQKIMADSSAPYGFWHQTHTSGGAASSGGWLIMDPLKSGSYPAEDVDPYVFLGSSTSQPSGRYDTHWAAENAAPIGVFSFLKKGLSGEGFVQLVGTYPYGSQSFLPASGNLGANPHNTKDELLPLIYARHSSKTVPVGYKGVSSFFLILMAARSNNDTYSLLTTRDKIVMGHLVADWDGTVPDP